MNRSAIAADGRLDVLVLLRRLWLGKWIIALAALLCTVLSIALAFFLPPQYEVVSVWQNGQEEAQNRLGSLAALAGFDVGNQEEDLTLLYRDLIASPDFLMGFADQEWLLSTGAEARLAEIMGVHPENFVKKHAFETESLYVRDKLVKALEKTIDLNIADVITLTVRASDPQFAADFNRALMDKLMDYSSTFRLQGIRERIVFLEGREQVFQDSLRLAETRLNGFLLANRSLSDPTLILIKDRKNREVDLWHSLAVDFKRQLELAKAEEMKKQVSLHLLTAPALPMYPIFPNKKLLAILGLGLGLFVGVIAALLVDWWRQEGRVQVRSIFKAEP